MALGNRISLFLAFVARSVLWSVHIGLFFYTLFVYYLLGSLLSEHWFASMLMITLPVAWLGLALLALIWLFFRPWRALLSLAAFLIGYWLWPRTLSLDSANANPNNRPTLTLLSYNVSAFATDEFYEFKQESKKSQQLVDWVVKHPAPVKCFQEFYTGSLSPTYEVRQRLEQAGYRYRAFLQPINDGYVGVTTFSKYPIIGQGRRAFGSFNGMVWADIKLGADTVRIINVHMQSMGIRVRRVFENEEIDAMKSETRTVLGALKAGFVARRHEVRLIEQCVQSSPYPVIVTGDFNDTPYSIIYERLRHRLHNAFEDGGSGFGFTLNRAPRFIRIDNQFYDPKLYLLRFDTHRDIPYSDHYPIEGEYALP
ncbi:endonuclease/exonuclease/phosphatase family protein [Fibrella sp. WM1]|uniref:endonuclease/exonuclease/phosphatase family protein n=1 Tax=Fibrella musci TaxID=3242485 RepID=UPI0035217266